MPILTINVMRLNGAEGSVIVSPSGDFIPPNQISYANGTAVTLTAQTSNGFFDHWDGDLQGPSPTQVLLMNRNWSITAVFDTDVPPDIDWLLTTGITGNGSVAPSSGGFKNGARIILVATPSSGYRFQNWAGNIAGTSPIPGRENNLQVTMDRDRHIVAEFAKVTTPPPGVFFFLETSVIGSGTIARNPNDNGFPSGTTVVLTATPSVGYKFVEWRGNLSGTNPTASLLMDEDKFVTALFEKITVPSTFSLTVTIIGNGTVSKSPNQVQYAPGTQVTLKATPSTGYKFVAWRGDFQSASTTVIVTMDRNLSVQAVFEKIAAPPPSEPNFRNLSTNISKGA